MRYYFVIFSILWISSCQRHDQEENHTRISTHDFLRDFPALTPDSLVNIVVEIPAGCNQKWEVNKKNGFLEWESVNKDSLRIVRYLPYPANYGMIPQTWLPESEGGDNDPLDIFLLGKTRERGGVVPARVIGIIKMLDRGEQDDKLIAVPVDDWHYHIHSLEELQSAFPGVIDVLQLWLMHYKGHGKIALQHIGNETTANDILRKAINYYQTHEEHIEKQY